MFGITDLATYVLGTIAIILLPGPNSLYVLSVAAQRGVKKGYQGACGVFVGDFILMLLSATGVAGVLKANPTLFFVLKYAGAAYLGWIGLQMLIGALRRLRRGQTLAEVATGKVDDGDPFRKALLISLLNPKAILFFVSFFIQFVDPGYPYPALTFAVLGAIVQACSALYLTAVILVGARVAAEFRRRQRLAASMAGGVGALFIGFGAKLATASMN
ncbi:leucine efflux protein LeuE [Crenobacter luteus]|uniref:Leucine efflux protein n=1 Tax=Crenobacter luteus TaxID=1452487 RepID=A0A163CD25_9NEIS|nr:leucine efflux protein LeuE [Crenobacter luteus]KZE31496.1 leucine efflux protein [Crenobacter luteus]